MKEIHRQNTDVRKHYTVNKNSAERTNVKLLYAGELTRTFNWQEQLHSHPFCEIVYVKSGTGILHTQNGQTVINEGDLLIYAPETIHSESSSENEELSLYFCGIDRLFLGENALRIVADKNGAPVLKTDNLKEDLEKYFSALISEVQSKSYYYDDISRSLVNIIIDLILRLLAQKDAKNFKTNETYFCARKFIDENYDTMESVEEICAAVHVSRYYLTHLFKEYSGISPMHYIISKRMEKAKQLLITTSLPVCQIARLSGYTEEPAFLKAFKKYENTTPGAFRKKHKSNTI